MNNLKLEDQTGIMPASKRVVTYDQKWVVLNGERIGLVPNKPGSKIAFLRPIGDEKRKELERAISALLGWEAQSTQPPKLTAEQSARVNQLLAEKNGEDIDYDDDDEEIIDE